MLPGVHENLSLLVGVSMEGATDATDAGGVLMCRPTSLAGAASAADLG